MCSIPEPELFTSRWMRLTCEYVFQKNIKRPRFPTQTMHLLNKYLLKAFMPQPLCKALKVKQWTRQTTSVWSSHSSGEDKPRVKNTHKIISVWEELWRQSEVMENNWVEWPYLGRSGWGRALRYWGHLNGQLWEERETAVYRSRGCSA